MEMNKILLILSFMLSLSACQQDDNTTGKSISSQWYENYGSNLSGYDLENCKGLTGPECEESLIDAFILDLKNYYDFDESLFDGCTDLDICSLEYIEYTASH